MPSFDIRHALLVVLPALALGCSGSDDVGQDGADSEADSSGAPTTGVDTIDTSPPNPTAPTTTSATTGPTATTSMGTTPTATDPTADGTDTDVPPACEGTGLGSAEMGETCTANEECISGVCTIFADAPLTPDATCDETPFNCGMRVTASAIDIVTRQTPPGIEMVVASALQAATNPTGVTPLGSATSDGDGRIDITLEDPPNAPIGLVALLSGPSYELTATGLAAPLDGGSTYAVANSAHDLWLVSTNAVAAWSNMLSLDPTIPPDSLPLVAAGGIVGLVRDADGLPLAGATVSSSDAGSGAIVRYLAGDGTFNTTGTGDLGLFVILEPALAEVFEAELDGISLGQSTGGSANDVVFTMVFTAP